MASPELKRRDDGSLVVEAPTVESALAAVQHHCGPDATIVEAEKVQSKGIGGFFSKQLFRVHVAASSVSEEVSGATSPVEPQGVGAAVDVVLRQVEAGEHDSMQTFGQALSAQLSSDMLTRAGSDSDLGVGDDEPIIDLRDTDEPSDVPIPDVTSDLSTQRASFEELTYRQPTHADEHIPLPSSDAIAPPPGPKTETRTRVPLGRPMDEWAPGSGPVRWSMDQLSRLGLPYRLIHGLAHLDPEDDLAWVFRLAESASSLCGQLPQEAMLLIGNDIVTMGSMLGIETGEYPLPPMYEGDAALSVPTLSESADFVDRVSAGRPIHIVCDVGGFGAELLDNVGDELSVATVSTTPAALALALQIAVATDAVLGYLVDGDRMIRLTPFELALAVRDSLPRD